MADNVMDLPEPDTQNSPPEKDPEMDGSEPSEDITPLAPAQETGGGDTVASAETLLESMSSESVEKETTDMSLDIPETMDTEIAVSMTEPDTSSAVSSPLEIVPQPSEDVASPTENVTSPTENDTRSTDNNMPPTENDTPPTENITPPTENITPSPENSAAESLAGIHVAAPVTIAPESDDFMVESEPSVMPEPTVIQPEGDDPHTQPPASEVAPVVSAAVISISPTEDVEPEVQHVSPDSAKHSGAGAGQKKDEKKGKPKQTCVVCGKVSKCKYNIVRNGDIKHLCDDSCFKVFRADPTRFLKKPSTPAPGQKPSPPKSPKPVKSAKSKGERTCDNCSKNCIEAEMQSHGRRRFCSHPCKNDYKSQKCCYHCIKDMSGHKEYSTVNVPQVGERLLCSSICKSKYEVEAKRRVATAHAVGDGAGTGGTVGAGAGRAPRPARTAPAAPSSPAADDDVQIVSATIPSYKSHTAGRGGSQAASGRSKRNFRCAVCANTLPVKHEVSLDGTMHKLCSDACFTKFRASNKLSLRDCALCGAHMMTVEGQLGHSLQSEGKTIPFCGSACVSKYKVKHAANVACHWCQIKRSKFTMVENKDESTGKYSMFCTLNCLSLYRVNVQATSNNSVKCNQCSKVAPAQYHLTMSDASVRNFCSYACVMSFQSKFSLPSSGTVGVAGAQGGTQATPQGTQHRNTATATATPPAAAAQQAQAAAGGGGGGRRSGRVASKGSPVAGGGGSAVASAAGDMPLISNVISLASTNHAPKEPRGVSPAAVSNSSSNKTPRATPPAPSAPHPPTKAASTTSTASTSMRRQQIVVQPPSPKVVRNKSLMCKPFAASKAVSCKPLMHSKECQTDPIEEERTKILVPVPVPIYVPVPMGMYNFPVPYPVPLPIPVPIPCFIPTTKKSGDKILKHIQEIMSRTPSDPLEAEMLAMAEAVAAPDPDSDSDSDAAPDLPPAATPAVDASTDLGALFDSDDFAAGGDAGEEDMLQLAMRMALPDDLDLETSIHPAPIQALVAEAPSSSSLLAEDSPPSPPPPAPRRGRKRRGSSTPAPALTPRQARAKRGRPDPTPAPSLPSPPQAAPPPDANFVLKFTYGVNAFRHWVAGKNAALAPKQRPFKADLLASTADELNKALTLFVKEVRKPNGEMYAPDSIFYLCLGIQQYLFENNRIDNIFTDIYFEQFTDKLNEVLNNYEVRLNHEGLIVCRIEEEHLWEARLLGAHSPHVLLHSLIYFNAKFFMLRTPEEHLALSSVCISKHWRKTPNAKQPRQMYLRYTPPMEASKRARLKEEPVTFEQVENVDNPLRCPVKLYEFFLSKCPEAVRSRNDTFYLVPELSCVPDSPVWYSVAPLPRPAMTRMLNRVRVVKEIQEAHLHYQPPANAFS